MKRQISTFLITAVCVIGVGLLALSNYAADFRDWRASNSWATTPSDTFNISPKTSTVSYSYTVNGRTYNGRRSHFFMVPYQDNRWTEWMVAHQTADAVTVYYDPDAPQRSVLVPQTDMMSVYLLPFSLLACLAIIAVPLIIWGGFARWFRRQF